MLSRVRKNDLVSVISGRDKGKQGRVIVVDPKKGRALVKGVSLITKHKKPRRQGEKGGIIKEESYMSLAKIMPICSACKKACRVKITLLKDEKKRVRICHRCKEAF